MGIHALWLPGLDHAGLATHEKILAYQKENSDKTYEHCAQYIEKTHKKIILEQIQTVVERVLGQPAIINTNLIWVLK